MLVLNLYLFYKDIDSQLRTAAEAFLENDDGCVVDSGKREVQLSQIFKWYKVDFGGTDEKVVLTPKRHFINNDVLNCRNANHDCRQSNGRC